MTTQTLKQLIALSAIALALVGCGKSDEVDTASKAAAAAAECDKIADPQPKDESAAARGKAAADGIAARAICNKAVADQFSKDDSSANSDLARIRELAEKEDAEREAAKTQQKTFAEQMKEGGAKPIRELKY